MLTLRIILSNQELYKGKQCVRVLNRLNNKTYHKMDSKNIKNCNTSIWTLLKTLLNIHPRYPANNVERMICTGLYIEGPKHSTYSSYNDSRVKIDKQILNIAFMHVYRT